MSIAERIRQEVQEIGFVALFFLVCFLTILSMKKLLLAEYDIPVTVLGTAVLGALIVAKVVVLADKTSVGERFASATVALHVLWRSLVYTSIVFAVTVAEHLFELYRHASDFSAALATAWQGRDWHQLLAMNLGVAISFLIYNSFHEIDRRLGGGGLRSLFFGRRVGDS